MKLRYNRSGIAKVSNELKEEIEEFKQIRQKILDILNGINTGWTGIDSSTYVQNTSIYVSNLSATISKIDEFANFYKNTSNRYKNNDSDYVSKVNKVNRIGERNE